MERAQAIDGACWRCGAGRDAVLVCLSCDAVQPVATTADRFAVLGLPRCLVVDAADLERRYHEASRLVHPDRHQTAGERERELSLSASAAVNRAYRTLRDPVARGRYWLELHGTTLAERDARVPSALAAEVFQTQETLEALRQASGVDAERLRAEVATLREGLTSRLEHLRDDLVASYGAGDGDVPVRLEDLKRRLSEIAYLRTLLGDVEDSVGEGLRGTHHRH